MTQIKAYIKNVATGRYLTGGLIDKYPSLSAAAGDDYELTIDPNVTRQWYITDLHDDIKSIRSVSCREYLDGRGPSYIDPCLSSPYRDATTDEYLQFRLEDLGNGTVAIESVSSGRYLDGHCIVDGLPSLATPVAAADRWNNTNLQWVVTETKNSELSMKVEMEKM
ncbi:hypothetical protein HDU97_008570 [Phlyctochytrium planicorne]|nr:hypothetical protein HDU97_008570 [Phlyctochytrium planicorne]